jgi:hypothetical protein
MQKLLSSSEFAMLPLNEILSDNKKQGIILE